MHKVTIRNRANEYTTLSINKATDKLLAELCEANYRSKKSQMEMLILEAWKAKFGQLPQPEEKEG